MPILGDWNQAKAKPPESEQQVVHKIESAIKNHPVPSLNLLNTNGWSGKGASARVPEDEPPIPTPLWPAAPGPDAYHGLAGEIVRVIEPHTEADPVALLVQLLIAFGSIIGRAAHASVGAARHYCNEFALLVGETSSARKGSFWSEVLNVIGGIDPDWIYRTGLSSGEGLIYHVRDPVIGKEPIKDKGKIIGYQDVTTDHGVDDKRLLVVETEFGGVLRVLAREGNKLSAVVRQAWDGGKLATMTKSFPYRATDAHVSLIGHITADELTKLLTSCDQANGFANRMLWVCCRRSKLLPFGGRVPDPELDRIRVSLSEAVAFAKAVGWIQWTPEAMELWREIYPRLTAPRPGVLGMVTSRAEAHTLRLATSHALMNRSWTITLDHLLAALALWNYCERSAAYIFGDRLGDKDAEAILEALRAAHGGMTRTEIRRSVFGDNKTADLVASKMGILRQHGLARSESITTNGRPAERWFPAKCDVKNVLNVESPAGVMPTPDPHHVKHVNHVPRGTENGSSEGTPPPVGREVFEI